MRPAIKTDSLVDRKRNGKGKVQQNMSVEKKNSTSGIGHESEGMKFVERASARSPGRNSKGATSLDSMKDAKSSMSSNRDDSEGNAAPLDTDTNDWKGLSWTPADVSETHGTWCRRHHLVICSHSLFSNSSPGQKAESTCVFKEERSEEIGC